MGAFQFRHALTPGLRVVAGHIGYGIRPSYRRRGLASFALSQALEYARRLGLERVLLTTDDDNVGSIRTIERHGGQLWDTLQPEDHPDRNATKPWRRYWITL